MGEWIGPAISIGLFLLTVVGVGIKVGSLQRDVESQGKEQDRMRDDFATKSALTVVSDRLQEDRVRNDKRIEELYQSRNELGRQMERVVTLIEGLGTRFDGVEKKIDELKKGEES